jgi:toxin ParE1/3/4
MHYKVLLTKSAEHDLEAIYDYITEYDSRASGDYVLNHLLSLTESLSAFPERGTYPKELQTLGIREYRQNFFKPYRIIYRIIEKQVLIYLIADGRRDMQSLLARRLLDA